VDAANALRHVVTLEQVDCHRPCAVDVGAWWHISGHPLAIATTDDSNGGGADETDDPSSRTHLDSFSPDPVASLLCDGAWASHSDNPQGRRYPGRTAWSRA